MNIGEQIASMKEEIAFLETESEKVLREMLDYSRKEFLDRNKKTLLELRHRYTRALHEMDNLIFNLEKDMLNSLFE